MDLIILDHTLLSLQTNRFVSICQIPASLSANRKHSRFHRSVRVHWRTWAAALSLGCEELFDLVIFSQIWTRIKGAKPFKEGGKYGILSSCGPIKDRRKQEPDRWADMDVVRSAARSGLQWILYSRCTLALSGEPTVLICSCSSFSATQQFLLARLKLRSFTVFLRGDHAWMVKYSLDWDSPCQQVHADDASGSGRRPSKESDRCCRGVLSTGSDLINTPQCSHVLVYPVKISAYDVLFFFSRLAVKWFMTWHRAYFDSLNCSTESPKLKYKHLITGFLILPPLPP